MEAIGSDRIEAELKRRWYDKPNPALIQLCDRRREAGRVQYIRGTIWLGVLIYVGFGFVDFILVPDVAARVFTARVVLGAIGLILIEAMIRFKVSAARIDLVVVVNVLGFYIACLFLSQTSSHADAPSYYLMFGVIYMMAATMFLNFGPALSLVAGLAFFVIVIVAMILMAPESPSFYFGFGSLYGSCFAFSAHGNWRLNAERYNVFLNALQAEIRQEEVLEQGKELLRLSNTDALTGLENRRSIDARLRGLCEDNQRSGARFAVLLLDIDFFKRFNDGYGHQEGDRCLSLVAKAIAAAAAGTFGGWVGRYGGEEFIVLAPLETPDAVPAIAETIRSAVEDIALAHAHRRDGTASVTVSVGVTVARSHGASTPETIVREADLALYEAKANGRNRVRCFDPDAARTGVDGENIAALLKVAVAQDLVSVVYQPIRGIASGRIEGVETLMRLRTLDGTPVPPDHFIPVADRTGTIVELGLWAIRTVCRDLLVNGDVPVASVNVSFVQLRMPGFAASVAAILGETGISGHRLALEITAGPDLEGDADVLFCIANLKQLGLRIWLDDFGTGFAGLSWLRLIDFDVVKIDRPFLQYCSDPKGRAMMRDIVAFVSNRGHKVLVEGVETQDQLSLMQDLGIDQVQGYYIGCPLPESDYRMTWLDPPPVASATTGRRSSDR